MDFTRLVFVVISAALPFRASAALVAPGTPALVIGNGAYAYMPPLPGCDASARAVVRAARGAGFDVTEKTDLASGAMQAALGDFAARAGGGAAFVYVCGYAGTTNGRDFLLPVTASVSDSSDLLGQGVLARSAFDVPGGRGVVLLDAVPVPGLAPPAFIAPTSLPGLPATVGAAAVLEGQISDAPTPLAAAIAAGLAARESPATLLAGLKAALGPGARVAALHTTEIGWMPPVSAPAATPSPTAAAGPATPAPMAAVPAVQPAPAPSAPVGVDEAHMSVADRRAVQIALARLGYYDGRIDGVFGPETSAAIRRFQHELKAEMTGTLDAAQASQLLRAP